MNLKSELWVVITQHLILEMNLLTNHTIIPTILIFLVKVLYFSILTDLPPFLGNFGLLNF